MNLHFIPVFIGALLALTTIEAWSAKAPVAPKDLKKQSKYIVSGTVIEVSSKVQKSKIETGRGFHRDRIYRIKIKVTSVAKGSGVKIGDVIEVVAWKPVRRIPPVTGLQGHDSIPEKGDGITVYVKSKTGKNYEPVLPNGISIKQKKKKKQKKPTAKR